jgi:hypothetical protein
MIRRTLALALTTSLLLQHVSVSHAYVTFAKWNPSTTSYYVNPQNADLTAAATLTALQTAASYWWVQSGASVRLNYAGQVNDTATVNDGRNVVMFRPGDSTSPIGTTYSWRDGSNNFLDSDIIFWDSKFTFFTGTSGCGVVSNATYLEDVAAHEFGHFFGLQHSAVATATMASGMGYCSQANRVLDPDDISGILSLYPATAATAPTITTHPLNASRTVGQTATFSVTATGTAPLTYQWQSQASGATSFTSISGATTSSYTTPILALIDHNKRFRCNVTNSAGTATSNAATLTVTDPPTAPTISSQPQNASRTVGQTASFSVTASGTSPFTYQWQSQANGATSFTSISGATSNSYTTPALALTDHNKQFRCVVTNSAGSATSNAATLTVTAVAPTITAQPSNASRTVGQTALFSVTASGTSPFTYQWQSQASGATSFTSISGAAGSTYTTPSLTLADHYKQFRCVVTNSAGSATSTAALLIVTAPVAPTITTQPLNSSRTVGQTASFSVAASGTSPFTYQWQSQVSGATSFTSISGATSNSYTTPAVALIDHNKQFRCVITNSAGTATSNAAILTVTDVPIAPTITEQPVNATRTVGQTVSFRVTATGTALLTYQWQSQASGATSFTAISGATSNSYTTPTLALSDHNKQFRCVITNSAGTATSNAAILTVNAAAVAPTITAQPLNASRAVGQTASLSVTASGTAPLMYQWQSQTSGATSFTSISGATSNSYTTPALALTDHNKQFRCIVTNNVGSVTSNAALLTVTSVTAPTITQHPANLSRNIGQTAAFSVAASGTSPFTYQWQSKATSASSFTSISGATGNTYTTPSLTMTEHNKQFRCIVTNGGGSTTSNAAILTLIDTRPVITSPGMGTGKTNLTLEYQIVATNSPTSYGATGLAPGLIINTATGLISGKPTSVGTFNTTIIATNSSGNGTKGWILTVDNKRLPKVQNVTMNGHSGSATSSFRSGSQATFVAGDAPSYVTQVSGTDFATGDILRWNDSAVSTTLVGTTQMSAVLPASLIKEGKVTVQIVTSEGDLSEPFVFTISLAPNSLDAVTVYPNPWRQDRHSVPVTFTSLPVDATIKIFTVAGHAVKSLRSSGGSTSWDLTNDAGEKVASGSYIYLIQSASSKKSGQIVVIR